MRYRVSWWIYLLLPFNTLGESTTCLWQWFNDHVINLISITNSLMLASDGLSNLDTRDKTEDTPFCLPLECELPSINRRKDATGSYSAWPHTSTFHRPHKISNLAEWQIPKLCPINKLYWTSCDFCLQAPCWLIIGQHRRKWSEHK